MNLKKKKTNELHLFKIKSKLGVAEMEIFDSNVIVGTKRTHVCVCVCVAVWGCVQSLFYEVVSKWIIIISHLYFMANTKVRLSDQSRTIYTIWCQSYTFMHLVRLWIESQAFPAPSRLCRAFPAPSRLCRADCAEQIVKSKKFHFGAK